jgi:hypothetical protein
MENNTINNSTNPRISVKNLRQSGFKVRVGHYRWTEFQGGILKNKSIKKISGSPCLQIKGVDWSDRGFYPKGGTTTIELTKDGIDASGEAICCLEDNYNRKLGVKIALGRALAAWQAKKAWPCMLNQKINLIKPVKVGSGS